MNYGNVASVYRSSHGKRADIVRLCETIRNEWDYEIPCHLTIMAILILIIPSASACHGNTGWPAEDMVPWFYTDQWKTVSDAWKLYLYQEDIYMLKDGFKPLLVGSRYYPSRPGNIRWSA
jgi:hypothetical protein